MTNDETTAQKHKYSLEESLKYIVLSSHPAWHEVLAIILKDDMFNSLLLLGYKYCMYEQNSRIKILDSIDNVFCSLPEHSYSE